MPQGKVLWFNPMKDFGSIVGDDGVTAFVTVDGLNGQLKKTWMGGLASGLAVRYELKKDIDSGEYFAVEVVGLAEASVPGKTPSKPGSKLVPPDQTPAQLPMRALWTDLGKLAARRSKLGEKAYLRQVLSVSAAYLVIDGEKSDQFLNAALPAIPKGKSILLRALAPCLLKNKRHDWFRRHLDMWSQFLRPRSPRAKKPSAQLAKRVASLRRALGQAFRSLEKGGILARANFTCCGTCASAELGELVRRKGAKGGIYWHQQDEERLRETGEVDLGYVSGSMTTAEVGLSAVRSLEKAGLTVHWNRNPGERIRLMPS
jgi:cold shock CspA family protein